MRVGSHKEFEFGIGEYHSADIAAIHHHALISAHLLLHSHQLGAHLGNLAHGTHKVAHLDSANLALYPLAINIDIARATLGVEAEFNGDAVEQLFEFLLIDHTVLDCAVFECVECHGTIHCARIDKDIAQSGGNHLGKCALAAR